MLLPKVVQSKTGNGIRSPNAWFKFNVTKVVIIVIIINYYICLINPNNK